MSSSINTESQKSPDELEREIETQRASISNLVDSLENRFTPGQLFDQALAYTKGHGAPFFQNLGATVKNNPVPTVLTGIGLAWLAMSQNKPFSSGAPSSREGLGETIGSALGRITGAFSNAGNRLHQASDRIHEKTHDLRDKASSYSKSARESLSSSNNLGHTAHEASDQIHAKAAQFKSQFDHVLHEQPLVIAAVGIALGAVMGAVIPTTRKEDELLGETSDNVAATVKSKGEEAYGAVKEMANRDEGKPEQNPASTRSDVPEHDQQPTDLSAGLGTRT
jgi:ElaB/YqjD/DUF883 family membrane-anchored ribosome-binding protein